MPSTEQRRQIVPDRRVRRTRKLLHDAFISLVIEKGYEKTTIQDILIGPTSAGPPSTSTTGIRKRC